MVYSLFMFEIYLKKKEQTDYKINIRCPCYDELSMDVELCL